MQVTTSLQKNKGLKVSLQQLKNLFMIKDSAGAVLESGVQLPLDTVKVLGSLPQKITSSMVEQLTINQ